MDFQYEINAVQKGYKSVCGVDEAGRGPLCGPVCAAAVILPTDCEIEGINDSKKLSEKKRDMLFDIIKEKALAYSVVMVDAKTIDEINILQATFKAMREAVEGLSVKADIARLTEAQRNQALQAMADALKLLNEANPNDQVVKLKAIEAMQKMAEGQATKIIIPSEMQGLVGLASGLVESVKEK